MMCVARAGSASSANILKASERAQSRDGSARLLLFSFAVLFLVAVLFLIAVLAGGGAVARLVTRLSTVVAVAAAAAAATLARLGAVARLVAGFPAVVAVAAAAAAAAAASACWRICSQPSIMSRIVVLMLRPKHSTSWFPSGCRQSGHSVLPAWATVRCISRAARSNVWPHGVVTGSSGGSSVSGQMHGGSALMTGSARKSAAM
mmetsp:Transcript_29575/g.69201  ORF Transcript_29575/g.69201 Transcript_29575/m.69201 type:complete len:204 (+) Transcript_29575:137-748(+)